MIRQEILAGVLLGVVLSGGGDVFGASQVLIPAGSVWKYQPITNDVGFGWRLNDFDDRGWSSGPAQLGYGDQDEATVVPFYWDETGGKNISTYFRRTFSVTNRALVTNLVVRLLRDDGAVVYLNGAELFRSNMPTGEVTHSTRALASIGPPEEHDVFVQTNAPAAGLFDRTNVLAVEIHQATPASADISFDLELIAESLASRPPTVSLTAPYPGSKIVPGADLALRAAAADPDGAAVSVEFFVDGRSLGVDFDAPFSLIWSDVAPGPHTLTVRATDDTGMQADARPVVVQGGGLSLIQAGSAWRYLDDQTDPGVAWREPVFDDSGWSNGLAPLGFGDGDEATVIRWKIDGIPIVTAYFRKQFVCPDPAHFSSVMLRLLRDDGGVVYLNGIEVFRSNMPEGPVDYRTYAAQSIGTGPEESVIYFPTNLPSHLLAEGTNTVAVEMHQITQFSSSDLSFDCELTAFPTEEATRLTVVWERGELVFSWPGWSEGLALFGAAALTSPMEWRPVGVRAERVAGRWNVRLPAGRAGSEFFKLFAE